MKPDPEEWTFSDALEEAEVEEANEHGAGAWIEFTSDGCAKVTIAISRELVEQARMRDLTTLDLFVEALRVAVPRAFGLPHPIPPRFH